MARIGHFPPLDVEYIENSFPKGFGANHNAAFARCDTPYFCVVNPDVRIENEPFSALIDCLRSYPGVAGPIVRSPDGGIEDSARRVPSLARLLRRVLLRRRVPDYPIGRTRQVDWVAGMFMIFDSQIYRELNGFDERYHLYCEDVDICLRTRLSGYAVNWVAQATIVHDARRASRRQIQFLMWHVGSMVRLLCSEAYLRFRRQFGGPANSS
ncbi:Rhamnosyltransferase WbbL [compost metagenome]